MNKIRIETKAGKIIERRAVLSDWIDADGRQSSLAQVGIWLYRVARRDYYGPVYKIAS